MKKIESCPNCKLKTGHRKDCPNYWKTAGGDGKKSIFMEDVTVVHAQVQGHAADAVRYALAQTTPKGLASVIEDAHTYAYEMGIRSGINCERVLSDIVHETPPLPDYIEEAGPIDPAVIAKLGPRSPTLFGVDFGQAVTNDQSNAVDQARLVSYRTGRRARASGTYPLTSLWMENAEFKRGYWDEDNFIKAQL